MSILSKNTSNKTCPECKGKKRMVVSQAAINIMWGDPLDKHSNEMHIVDCDVCNGEGTVDWVTYLMGKESAYAKIDKNIDRIAGEIGRMLEKRQKNEKV